ncbi:MAG: hypothetical protein ACRDKY_01420 [Solirubrobacteraceae bacterium]
MTERIRLRGRSAPSPAAAGGRAGHGRIVLRGRTAPAAAAAPIALATPDTIGHGEFHVGRRPNLGLVEILENSHQAARDDILAVLATGSR